MTAMNAFMQPAQQTDAQPVDIGTTMRTAELALNHHTALNRHRTQLLRQTKPDAAQFGYRLLTSQAAGLGNFSPLAEWATGEYCVCCAWFRHYAQQGLLETGDELALNLAQTRVARLKCGLPDEPVEAELTLLAQDPKALVRAAYAIIWDLRHPH